MSTIKWKLKKKPDGYEGFISVPAGMMRLPQPGGALQLRAPKPIAVKARGSTPSSALAKAASLAERITSNPIISAALPPGTGAALKATKFLASAATKGKLGKAMKLVTGKGAKRIAKALFSFF